MGCFVLVFGFEWLGMRVGFVANPPSPGTVVGFCTVLIKRRVSIIMSIIVPNSHFYDDFMKTSIHMVKGSSNFFQTCLR